MAMIGPAALAALIASMLFTSDGAVVAGHLPTLAAVAVAYLVVRRSGSVVHAFLVGLPVLWLGTALGL